MRSTTGRIEMRREPKKPKNGKLPTLPKDAQVSKRPLLHPTIPSPYAGAAQQKVIYVGSRTPFISVVKRAEKLLHLSDKRLVQSATRIAKDANYKKRRRGGERDEILAIAEEVEAKKRAGKRRKISGGGGEDVAGEEVVIKGSGKAISKIMELGVWFQEREEYTVRLQTGSVGAVDDVSYQEEAADLGEDDDPGGNVGVNDAAADASKGAAQETTESNQSSARHKPLSKVVRKEETDNGEGKKDVSETRIRQVSVLEVYVSLR